MRKSVGQSPTAGEQTQQKPCRTSSDIRVEQENHTVGRSDVGSERVNIAWKLFMIQELWGSSLASLSMRALGYVRAK
jgi:hypothetical protein